MQKDLRDFEAQLARFTGSENAIGVANATDGLELAWMSVGLQAWRRGNHQCSHDAGDGFVES